MPDAKRYTVREAHRICSPAFLVYRDLAEENTRTCIREAGGAERLWPHLKTHKMAEMVRMQMKMGIRRFKCATIAELNMAAACRPDALVLSYPLVGPNIALFLDAAAKWPDTVFYAIGDSIEAVAALSDAAAARDTRVRLLADTNLGMDRTGVSPDALPEFIAACRKLPGVSFAGLHLYDGHIHDTDLSARRTHAEGPMLRALAIRDAMQADDPEPWILIAGGSPTMPCHADKGVFLSPGTVFFWDAGYAASFPDMPYTPAAAVLTRVVSHPAPGLFTLDCGVKAVASDPQPPLRGVIAGLPNAEPVMQNEEHYVWRMPAGHEDERPAIGAVEYLIPVHVCPTTALYPAAVVISGGEIDGMWEVTARDRCPLLL